MTLAPVLLALVQAAHAEPQASVRGRAVVAETGEPLAGVTVELSARLHGTRFGQSARSAADGGFAFEGLAAGEYALFARKAGYLPVAGFPLPVAVAAGPSREEVTLRFHRHAVLAGVVAGADGAPVIGAEVVAYRYRWVEGRRSLARAASAVADDLGRYRLFGLSAGTYLLAALAPRRDWQEGELDRGGVTYYPSGAEAAEAARLRLRWGQEMTDVSITLRPQAVYGLSGFITDSGSGGPCRGCLVRVERLEEGLASGAFQQSRPTRPDGSYRASGLTPGTYRITAEEPAPPDGHYVAACTVIVGNRDLAGVNLTVGAEHAVRGRVVYDSAPDGLDREKPMPRVWLRDGVRLVGPVQAAADLTFQIRNLAPVPYRIRAGGAPGGYVKTVRVAGRDLPSPDIEVPEDGGPGWVEIVFAFDGASVTGSVQPPETAGRGHRVTSATVVLYPQENESAYLVERRVATDAGGAFTIDGVAPGAYTAFALPAGSSLDWDDPEVRREFARFGRALDLRRDKRATIELTLAPESY